MSSDEADTIEAELRQLWSGKKVPPLTSEQIDIALQLWRKIKARREREQN